MFKNLRYFQLDILLRRRAEIKSLINLCIYFEDIRKLDIDQNQQMVEENKAYPKQIGNIIHLINLALIPKNYINICKIHCTTLIIDSLLLDHLREISPSIFENYNKISMLPINIKIPSWVQDEDVGTINESIVLWAK